jgi:uncharacterized membrane protein
MQTERGLDRLTYFTDAIAAIAITLLILPIVDRVSEAHGAGESPTTFLHDNAPSLYAFALSFVLIARFWIAHHGLFEHVATYNKPLRWVSLAWAFSIALLPLPSAMTSEWSTEPVIVGFYIGTLTLTSATLCVMTIMVRQHPELESKHNPVPAGHVRSSAITVILFIAAFFVGTFVPRVNYFALLLLLLSAPIGIYFHAREQRIDAKVNKA